MRKGRGKFTLTTALGFCTGKVDQKSDGLISLSGVSFTPIFPSSLLGLAQSSSPQLQPSALCLLQTCPLQLYRSVTDTPKMGKREKVRQKRKLGWTSFLYSC